MALIKDVIINPDTGVIEGFWVKSAIPSISNPIIQTRDILEWKKNIYIKNESVISDPVDIIKISNILSQNKYIIGNDVQNEEGEYYGKVYSMNFNTEDYRLRQIYVQRSVLGFINYDRRIFSFDSIVEVTESSIIVDDKAVKKEKVIETRLAEGPSA